jgi:polar amino acid transport system ATP-binding protein
MSGSSAPRFLPNPSDGGSNSPVVVRVERVRKSFGSVEVLKNINFEIHSGEVVCLLGRSGSGKTTLVRCIDHLESPDGGRIWVNDELMGYRQRRTQLHELKSRELARSRRHVGIVFQQFNLFPHKTALENVIEGPVHVLKVPRDEAIREAKTMMEWVGLADRMTSYPSQLSGGQQQRVAIARALAMRPSLLLFDELVTGPRAARGGAVGYAPTGERRNDHDRCYS